MHQKFKTPQVVFVLIALIAIFFILFRETALKSLSIYESALNVKNKTQYELDIYLFSIDIFRESPEQTQMNQEFITIRPNEEKILERNIYNQADSRYTYIVIRGPQSIDFTDEIGDKGNRFICDNPLRITSDEQC